MTTLLDWWGFIWQLYVSTLQAGNQMGGVAMVLIWAMATAAAFAALVVAPVVFISKLVAFAFMLAFKAALVCLFAGTAIEVAKAIDHHQADHKAKVVQLQPPQAQPCLPWTPLPGNLKPKSRRNALPQTPTDDVSHDQNHFIDHPNCHCACGSVYGIPLARQCASAGLPSHR